MHFLLGHRIAISRALAVAFAALLLVSVSRWRTTAPIVEYLLSLIGWLLIAAGAVGRVWCGSYIAGFKNDKLITDGPYSICRNPLYLFSFVGGLGLMLITEMLLLPLVFAALFLSYYPAVIRHEERRLAGLHGAVFAAYRARVPRFWPRVGGYAEPQTYLVSAVRFRKHVADAMWFVIAGGAVEFFEGMHNVGYLPTLLHSY